MTVERGDAEQEGASQSGERQDFNHRAHREGTEKIIKKVRVLKVTKGSIEANSLRWWVVVRGRGSPDESGARWPAGHEAYSSRLGLTSARCWSFNIGVSNEP